MTYIQLEGGKNQSIEMDPEMTYMIELIGKGIKTAMM